MVIWIGACGATFLWTYSLDCYGDATFCGWLMSGILFLVLNELLLLPSVISTC